MDEIERLVPIADKVAARLSRRIFSIPQDDLTQMAREALLRLDKEGRVNGGGIRDKWLARRIENRLIDIIREQMGDTRNAPREVQRVLTERNFDDLLTEEPELPQPGIVRSESLTQRERQAFHLHVYADLTYSEAAKVMGVSPARVWRLTKRALAKVNRELENNDKPAAPISEGAVLVLQHAANGLTIKETAKEMGITASGVSQRRAEALNRLGAKTLPQAVTIALRRGYIK